MREHELKTWPGPFQALWEGRKRFEFRSEADRVFSVGDVLHLREWDPNTSTFTGRRKVVEVTYLLRGPTFGLPEGYVVLSISAVGACHVID